MSREPLFLRGASEDSDCYAQEEAPKFTTKDMKNLLNEQKKSICKEVSHMIQRQTSTARKVQGEIDNLREALRAEVDDEELETGSDAGILILAKNTIKTQRQKYDMAVDIIQNLRAKAKESKRDQRNQRDEIEDMKDEISLLKSRLKRQGHASYPRRR